MPKRLSAVATACCQSASLVTSRRTKTASPPAARMSASTLRPSASRTSPSTTLAPSLANRRASTAPMPRAPPLIKATFPANRIASLQSSVVVLRTSRGEGIVGEEWSRDKRSHTSVILWCPGSPYVHLQRNCAVIMACFPPLSAPHPSCASGLKDGKKSSRSLTMHKGTLVVLVLVLLGLIAAVLVWQLGPP